MTSHYTRMALIKSQTIPCVDKDVGKLEHSCIHEGMRLVQVLQITFWQFLKVLNLVFNLGNPFLEIYPREIKTYVLYEYVYAFS